jgi:predicted metal-binding membrane protein
MLTAYNWPRDPFLQWRLMTYGALLTVATLAWWRTSVQVDGMAMSTGPSGFSFFMVTWVVMMAAMMFPSVAPMVATYVSAQRGRRAKSMPAPVGASLLFVGGYLITWATAGLICFALLQGATLVTGDPMFWERRGRWLTVVVLLGAAVYELTPAKYACLSRCRNPIGFVIHQWRDGRGGALRMGIEQGAWCVGCCWALMAALVALGMMSLGWMAVVALLIAVEKLAPWRRVGTSVVTGALTLLALTVALAPDRVPGLMS